MRTVVRLLTTSVRPCSAPSGLLWPAACRCPVACCLTLCRRTITDRPAAMASRTRTDTATPRTDTAAPRTDTAAPRAVQRETLRRDEPLADHTVPKRDTRKERGLPSALRNSPKRKTPPSGSESGGQRLATADRDKRETTAARELKAAMSGGDHIAAAGGAAQQRADRDAQQRADAQQLNQRNVPVTNHQQNSPQRLPQVSGEEMLAKVRVWEPVSSQYQSPGQGPGQQFTMVSYNVLSQHLYDAHPELYVGAAPESTAWEVRGPRLWAQLVTLQPDIVCLQEVDEGDIETFWRPRCKLEGFNILFKKRTGKDKWDGCAVLYRESVFSLGELATVEYLQQDCRALDRDNVGIVVRLRGAGGELVVACTHLLYNPRRHDVKLAQVALLLAEVERLAFCGRQRTYLPVLLAGDLNLKPFSPVYNFLREGLLEYGGLDRKQLTPFGSGEQLRTALLPPQLGVNAFCRHVAVFLRRLQGLPETEAERRKAERQLLAVSHSERRHPRPLLPLRELAEEGYECYLAHGLGLKSVYEHGSKRDRDKEVTTNHRQWITVDYIFQSVSPPGSGRLELTSRLVLPTAAVCQRLQPYPSAALPSDHLPLAARFRLVPPGATWRPGHHS